jgi:glycosyltransferase involved in cell wall biosynthesis
MTKKICVYAIALNEEKFVEKFVASCEGADLIIIADTGSNDRTVSLARSLGITVYDISIKPWRFDHARNAALALIPDDIDICISLDMDEILVPGWRKIIEDNWTPTTTRLQYRFNNGMGNIFNATKVHARRGYSWHHLCHEMIEIDPRITESWATSNEILIEHHPDQTKSRGQYLPMLKASVQERAYDHRDSWYLAREFYYHKQWADAIKEWDRYLTLPGATWHHERSFALRHMGKCYMALKDHAKALKHFRMAIDEARYIRDTWMDLAQACFELDQWQECFYASTQGLTITEREYVFTSGPEPWGWKLYDLAALAAYNLKMKEQAIHYGGIALELNQEDPRLLKNCEYYLNM